MKNVFGLVAWILLTATAFSQSVDAVDAVDEAAQARDVEVELARIRSLRAEEEAHHAREQAACYDRFAVTDCLRRARAHRREVLDKLRRREIAVNDAERKRKAREQLERIRQNSQVLPESR